MVTSHCRYWFDEHSNMGTVPLITVSAKKTQQPTKKNDTFQSVHRVINLPIDNILFRLRFFLRCINCHLPVDIRYIQHLPNALLIQLRHFFVTKSIGAGCLFVSHFGRWRRLHRMTINWKFVCRCPVQRIKFVFFFIRNCYVFVYFHLYPADMDTIFWSAVLHCENANLRWSTVLKKDNWADSIACTFFPIQNWHCHTPFWQWRLLNFQRDGRGLWWWWRVPFNKWCHWYESENKTTTKSTLKLSIVQVSRTRRIVSRMTELLK